MQDVAIHPGAYRKVGGTDMTKKKPSLPRSLKLKSLSRSGGGRAACGNPLAFTMQPQQQTEWCWAAVSVSVNLYYHPASGQTQCAVANIAMGQSTCCQDGSTPQCNQPWFLDQALSIVGDLKAWSPGKVPFTTVKSEINDCRPLCLRIGWNGGGGHFVAVYGFSNTNNRLNVGDPWYGNSVVKYALFPGNYQGGGTWTDSYTTTS
jgi:hypothetical protein